MPVAEDQELIPLQEASQRFGKSVATLHLWLRLGKIKKYKRQLDRRVFVDAREIERKLRAEPIETE